jgi:hypothetical protein
MFRLVYSWSAAQQKQWLPLSPADVASASEFQGPVALAWINQKPAAKERERGREFQGYPVPLQYFCEMLKGLFVFKYQLAFASQSVLYMKLLPLSNSYLARRRHPPDYYLSSLSVCTASSSTTLFLSFSNVASWSHDLFGRVLSPSQREWMKRVSRCQPDQMMGACKSEVTQLFQVTERSRRPG